MKKATSKPGSPYNAILWKLFFGAAGAFLLFIILISLGVFGGMPSLAQLENPSIIEASEVVAVDGTLMGKYYKEKGNRSIVEYKDISKHVVNALIATEDERFYSHSGIDGKRFIGALVFFRKRWRWQHDYPTIGQSLTGTGFQEYDTSHCREI